MVVAEARGARSIGHTAQAANPVDALVIRIGHVLTGARGIHRGDPAVQRIVLVLHHEPTCVGGFDAITRAIVAVHRRADVRA